MSDPKTKTSKETATEASASTDTGSSTANQTAAVVKAAPTNTIDRDTATLAMNAIDALRKRVVKEAKSLRRSQARGEDLVAGIELREREAELAQLGKLHETIGTAFGLGGY